MNNPEISNNSGLEVEFDQGLEQVMSRPSNTTAERKRAKELYDKQRAAAYDTFDEVSISSIILSLKTHTNRSLHHSERRSHCPSRSRL